ncbi:MAG: hypothetical protein EX271_04410 [Acidimicrobiales bacterium]|nr:hypothetical protein [Hyphomonadaceae bacterium]RZV43165.1 MAG: hypothetical protein EX271_04410 [Acidimicrobiales bacterium]
MSINSHWIIGFVLALTFASPVQAKIIKSSPDHFTLRHEAVSSLTPKQIWKRLKSPASWWHPDHTYSGSVKNLRIDLRPGGLWRETWSGGSVAHGTVLYVKKGEVLRLDAPFGPLQEMAVTDIWTITVKPYEDGSKIIFDEIANGSPESDLGKMAKAVDFVKEEAIQRLAATKLPN